MSNILNASEPIAPSRFRFVADDLHDRSNEGVLIRNHLCGHGAPDATYLVRDGQVFVFKKLLNLLEQQALTALPSREVVADLVKRAWVPPLEAVAQWGVIPAPYAIVPDNGTFVILHQPFNATIPGAFASTEAALSTLASLLVGSIENGPGDFLYKGQPLTLCRILDPDALPLRPTFDVVEPEQGRRAFEMIPFEEGFSPVSKTLFEQGQQLELSWRQDNAGATQAMLDHGTGLKRVVSSLPFASLNRLTAINKMADMLSECDKGLANDLRAFYPELDVMTDAALYTWFDSYQIDCCSTFDWTPSRDNAFLLYLAGKLIHLRVEGHGADQVGRMVAFALLRGDTMEDAVKFARNWCAYDTALGNLASRIGAAMDFLAKDRRSTDLRGNPVATTLSEPRTQFSLIR